MSNTTCHMSISLNGFVAGPDQGPEHPLGRRGRELHGWHLGDARANEADATAAGWSTFRFVAEGFDAAYARALGASGGDGVDIAGGAATVRQALAAAVVDELTLDIAPVLLGTGERIFDGVDSLGMEPVEVLHSSLATHIRYRRVS